MRRELTRSGLIPAHAGKTVYPRASRRALRAHPHSRGENIVSRSLVQKVLGSSPLTRGKLKRSTQERRARGLIPAHAGKTPNPSWRTLPSWAHPRSCGENLPTVNACPTASGSSPLTQGKHIHGWFVLTSCGLIPAHAGKTLHVPAHRSASKAHPRSRGENMTQAAPGDLVCGSSPRTRGKSGT